MSKIWLWPNFTPEEMESPDLPGSGYEMQPKFMDRLQKARKLSSVPFVVSSGFRSEEHNKSVGGVKTSSHLTGWAADIRIKNNYERMIILVSLIEAGFRRIGIAETFIHVDCDPNKPNSIWTY